MSKSYIEYIKEYIDGKLKIEDYRILENEIAELICNEECPIHKPSEDGCDNDECIKYLKQFFERYKLVVKVIPKNRWSQLLLEEVDSDG